MFSGDVIAVRKAVAAAQSGLVDRELIAEVVVLCAVAGEHALVVGAPGTAKSAAVRAVSRQLGGAYFEYVLGRFTEPNEIFGPVDLRRLKDGVVEIETAGMLPEAEVAFLDEVFLGSTAILNTLLGLLNERVFRRGATRLTSPLRVCVGATNTLPDDPVLAAFADRFLVRVFVDPVADALLEELLETAWSPAESPVAGALAAVDRLTEQARAVDLRPVVPAAATAVRRLRHAGVVLSDRRVVRAQRLVAAAAVLDGRTAASAEDLWVLPLIAPSRETQALARDVLGDLIDRARNSSLVHAAEEFSRGPRARAERLALTAEKVLAGDPDRLRVEATLREIDAGFTAETLPVALADTRARLIATLRP